MTKSSTTSQQAARLAQMLREAMGFHQTGRLAEAENLYVKVLRVDPRQFDAQHLFGILCGQQGRLQDAAKHLAGAIKANSNAPAAHVNYSLVLSKLGRQQDAIASLDRALALKADNAEALSHRGNILCDLGRFDEAVVSYDRALAIRPQNPDVLNNRGSALGALQRFDEALASYDKALVQRPQFPDALGNRGSALGALGRFEEALASYDQLLVLGAGGAQIFFNRGNALVGLKRHEEALASYDRALALNPGHPEILDNRGNALSELHRYEEALASYEGALALNPNYPGALANRGRVLIDLKRHAEAAESYDRALALRPDDTEAYVGRGTALHALGRYPEAIASYDQALAIRPDHAEAHYNRAGAAQEFNLHEEALASFDGALKLKPDYAEAWYGRGYALRVMNRWREAIESYQQALTFRPDYPEVKFALCMAQLPVLYADEAEIAERRAAYGQHLNSLCEEVESSGRAGDYFKGVGTNQPFHLGYQALDDRELQARYGALVCRIMAEHFPPAEMPPPPGVDEPVRLGVVSGFFWWHSVWKIPIRGWISQLDRQKFRIFGYHTGVQSDSATEEATSFCDRFVHGTMPVERWREAILADAPHVLLYPDIGMDAMSAALAAQRLAPVQCMSLGHPDTSGYPTLDYFLTSDLMEPPDGESHYTERLVRLPGISLHYEPIEAVPRPIDREKLGLRAGATVFWCGQSLYKYLPQYDQVFARIAREAGDCQFAFIRYPRGNDATELMRQRLDRAFTGVGLDAGNLCVFLPRLDQQEFLAAVGQCDIVLDSIGWSGFNSTMEGLTHDVPVVTLAGALMRGRHTTGVLKMIGVTDTITESVDEYVAMAVRLARDLTWRLKVKDRMAANKHRAFRDRACVLAMEAFLERAARGKGGV